MYSYTTRTKISMIRRETVSHGVETIDTARAHVGTGHCRRSKRMHGKLALFQGRPMSGLLGHGCAQALSLVLKHDGIMEPGCLCAWNLQHQAL